MGGGKAVDKRRGREKEAGRARKNLCLIELGGPGTPAFLVLLGAFQGLFYMTLVLGDVSRAEMGGLRCC